jgi:hypothetical protein
MLSAGITAVRLVTNGRQLGHAIGEFRAGPSIPTAWNLAGQVVGVIGPDKFINAAIRYSAGLAARVGGLDAEAAAEMVELMQSRAPRRTGTLHDGIEAAESGGYWTIVARAQRYGNSADYARMVEFGTAAGERGRRVASDDYFAGPYAGRRGSINDDTGRRRRAADARRVVNRTHPGTPPQPYFVPTVAEVMGRRNIEIEAASDAVAAAEDLL